VAFGLAATDRQYIAPFTAAFPIVATDRPRADVRFDNVTTGDGNSSGH